MAYDVFDYERDRETANLAGAYGRSGAQSRYGGRADRFLAANPDADLSGIDIADVGEYGHLDPTQFGGAIRQLAGAAGRRVGARGGDAGRASNRAKIALNNRLTNANLVADERRGTAEFNETDEEVFQPAQERLNEMAGTSAISGEQEQALRGKITSQFANSALSNLARVGSSLGIRGVQDSPAGAALAAEVAGDYDRQLIGQLRDMGLQVSEINRDQQRKDTAAATALGTLRLQARQAYLANDREAVTQIGQDTAQLIAALYDRDKAAEMYEKQLEEASREGFTDRLGKYGNVLSSFPQFSFMGMGSSPGSTYSNQQTSVPGVASPGSGDGGASQAMQGLPAGGF